VLLWKGRVIEREACWLLGLAAADGYVGRTTGNETKLSFNCGNAEGDESFARFVVSLVDRLWGARFGFKCQLKLVDRDPPRRPYWEPRCYSASLVREVLGFCEGKTGTYDWSIPPAVLKAGGADLAAWISGFADGDGSVRFALPSRSVSIASVNLSGLAQIREALGGFGIKAGSYEYDREVKEWAVQGSLVISDRASLTVFRDKIGFRCQRKQAKLEAALASYTREAPNLLRDQVEVALPQVLERRARGESFESIATAMGLAGTEIPKGMIKRASKKAGEKCLVCASAPATHSIPRVVRGRAPLYVCEACLVKLEPAPEPWTDELVKLRLVDVAEFLDAHHYLGRRGASMKSGAFALRDRHGALVFSQPMTAALPREWLELSRWCLVSKEPNAGSSQWARVREWLLANTEVKTLVSYSDPSEHDGALYRASGWLWAPSSQYVLKNLRMTGDRHPEAPYVDKNRWVFALRPDETRQAALTIKCSWLWNREDRRWLCDWIEPRWNRRGRPAGGGKDFGRWRALLAERALALEPSSASGG